MSKRSKRTIEERLLELEARKRRADAEIRKLRARLSKEERKRDTRRKILIGAAVLAYAEKSANDGDDRNLRFVRRLVAGMSERDRAVFEGTPWHPEQENQNRLEPELDRPPGADAPTPRGGGYSSGGEGV